MAISFLEKIFAPGSGKAAGARLYEAVVAQARRPGLYTDLGAPDTGEGRFEVYSLHVALLLLRLKSQGAAASAVSQVLFDRFVSGLDHGLREMGVGDLSVGKKMRKLGEAFYGRVRAYEDALAVLPERTVLDELLIRTVYAEAEAEGAQAAALGDYVVACRATLLAQEIGDLVSGRVEWPAI